MSEKPDFEAARKAAMKCDRRLLQAAVAGQEAIRKLNAGDMEAAITQMAVMLISVRQFDAPQSGMTAIAAGAVPLGGWGTCERGKEGGWGAVLDGGPTA